MSAYTRLSDGTLVPAIPEPFWYRGWQTLFRYRPACYRCRLILRNRGDYEEHYVKCHSVEEQHNG